MAYRRKTTRKSARKTYGRKAPAKRKSYATKRRAAPKRKTARARKPQTITLVIQQAPLQTPTLATAQPKAKPDRARFTQ